MVYSRPCKGTLSQAKFGVLSPKNADNCRPFPIFATMKPLKFHHLLVPKLWGGSAIAALKGLRDAPALIGESFEISALPGQETYCSTPGFEGRTLPGLIEEYGAALMGKENYARFGTEFPLLVKFIDAREALSVQVHPDDAMAQSLGMPYGKSEMWYVIHTEPQANLLAGFLEDIPEKSFTDLLQKGLLTEKANTYDTRPGDAFYIPAGTLHSIGAGNLIIEVQQSSGATYRVYDFDRRDAQGKRRTLHVDLARQALRFTRQDDCHRHVSDVDGEGFRPLFTTPYFTSSLLRLTAPYELDLRDRDSFLILVCHHGSATLTGPDGHATTLRKGQTLLIPADASLLTIQPQSEFKCLAATV